MYESMETDKDKLVIERIRQYMKHHNIKMADIAKTLEWQPYKMSRFFSGEQRTTLKDIIDVTTALGYPLEAFLEEEFDLTKYESENKPAELETCMNLFSANYPAEDVLEEVISQELPYAIRKILKLDMRDFSFYYDLNRCDIPKLVNFDNEAGIRYWPKVTIRLQGRLSQLNDYLELGYFFAANDAVALCINYVPDMTKNEPGSGRYKRDFYKSLITRMAVNTYDKRAPRYNFGPALNHGEICSIVYSLKEYQPEVILRNDLETMFEIYKELIIESTDKMERFFWNAPENTDSQILRIMGKHEVEIEAKKGSAYKCFVDPSHETFETESGYQYVDTMHLIPLNMQEDYEADLDVPENIVCLCPNCMAKLTNGKRTLREEMLVDIYYRKRTALKSVGINVTLAQVLSAQQCD